MEINWAKVIAAFILGAFFIFARRAWNSWKKRNDDGLLK